MNAMPDLYPAVVVSYDEARRMARVKLPGITDGGDVMLDAELNNPLGDKSANTGIEILPDDAVWVAFQMGDPRYPVIMGYRPKQRGNELDYRRWHFKNIELDADGVLHIKAGMRVVIDAADEVVVNTKKATVNASTGIDLNTPTTNVSGDLVVAGNVQAGGNLSVSGNGSVTGTFVGDGINLKTHTHPGVQSGGASTGPAQ